jgi:hypothetical protein
MLRQIVAREYSRERSVTRQSSTHSDYRQPPSEAEPLDEDRPRPTVETTTSVQDDARRRNPETPVSSLSQPPRYSKKLPDPTYLTNGDDPTFESWRFQIKNKLRANADHFPTEEDKIAYVFNRTAGNAQKHLSPRIDEDSPVQFTAATQMIQHLASIYVNPNKARDARYKYNKLLMKSSDLFREFQTTFLYLAGEGQIHESNLRMDLFDKITPQLQERLAATLEDLDTYEKFATRCLSLDTELRRIHARIERQKRFTKENKAVITTAAPKITPPTNLTVLPSTPIFPRTTTPASTRTPTTEPTARQLTPGLHPQPLSCFNCKATGHVSRECPEPKRKLNINDIEEEIEEYEEQQSGNEDA